jgi:UDPglucose--hexose-1-phosphate uridylyltransferase
MSELRRELVTGEWVIIAEDREKRPYHFSENEQKEMCPFCPANGDMSEKEILRIGDDKSWTVRVIPNKYPAVCPADQCVVDNMIKFCSCEGVGHHEIVIETEQHHIPLHELTIDRVHDIFKVYKKRMQELISYDQVRYVQIYKNHGRNAGASLPHSHSQIIALPFMPPRVEKELLESEKYYQNKGSCIFCDIIKEEVEVKERLLCTNKNFISVINFAPRFAYETWIIPLEHNNEYCLVNDEKLKYFAEIFIKTMKMLSLSLGEFPYNLVLHTGACDCSNKYYHWHFEIVPRVTYHAGFEISTGAFINDISPEEATKEILENYVEGGLLNG